MLTTAGPLMLVEGALVVAVTTVVYPMLNGPDITPPPPLTGEAPLEQALVVKGGVTAVANAIGAGGLRSKMVARVAAKADYRR